MDRESKGWFYLVMGIVIPAVGTTGILLGIYYTVGTDNSYVPALAKYGTFAVVLVGAVMAFYGVYLYLTREKSEA